MKLTALSIGKSDCIATALKQSEYLKDLYVMSEFANPGISEKASDFCKGNTTRPLEVVEYARRVKPDFAIIASEEPLAHGVVDALQQIGVRCVGPVKSLARLESSKSFTRQLLTKYNIPGNPKYRTFHDETGLSNYLHTVPEFVVKPDGLTGGKGVKVFGDHFSTVAEALDYCRELFESGQPAIVIEEKLDGEEFSFQSFYDGRHIAHTIPIQDHKRAFDDDTGPNTGGMGSYSCADHLLPFLSKEHVAQAAQINRLVGEALLKETGEEYKGILYGGFMLTGNGLRVIEYNARFGDPEVMNIVSLLETDFVEICLAIINGTLDKLPVRFRRQASVCKYIVPAGYPKKSSSVGAEIDLGAAVSSAESNPKLRVYYGAVDKEADGKIRLTDSRSLAFVGVADTLREAERIAESAASSVKGNVFHRRDIGTSALIQKRVDHMDRILHAQSGRRTA